MHHHRTLGATAFITGLLVATPALADSGQAGPSRGQNDPAAPMTLSDAEMDRVTAGELQVVVDLPGRGVLPIPAAISESTAEIMDDFSPQVSLEDDQIHLNGPEIGGEASSDGVGEQHDAEALRLRAVRPPAAGRGAAVDAAPMTLSDAEMDRVTAGELQVVVDLPTGDRSSLPIPAAISESTAEIMDGFSPQASLEGDHLTLNGPEIGGEARSVRDG